MNLKPLSTVFHGRVLSTSSFFNFGFEKNWMRSQWRELKPATRSPAAGQFDNILASASGVKLIIPISHVSYELYH